MRSEAIRSPAASDDQQVQVASRYTTSMSDFAESRSFVGYVGGPQLHDASVVRLDSDGKDIHVLIKSLDGGMFRISFLGVQEVSSNRPEGMMLYALAEIKASEGSLRRFSFVNWNENDDARLELIATDYRIESA